MDNLYNATNVTLVRHGETDYNAKGCYFGQLDPSLNLNGNIQAEKTSDFLKFNDFDIIYSSDLVRCIKTAKIINTYHNLELRLSSKLRELNFGIFEGKTYTEILNEFPKESDLYFKKWKSYVIPQGESLELMKNRCVDEVEKIIKKNQGKSILIVTHSGVIKSLLAYYLSSDLDNFWKYNLDYASMTKLVFTSDNYVYAEYINRI